MADRKISDLTALTTPASGDYLPIVDISESAAASKNKRITVEALMRGAPDGTAAAPSIAFESDPNTGIYSPGADQLAVSTGGTGRLFVAADGSVGIGVIPTTTFDVNGSVKISTTGGNDSYFGFGANYDNYFTSGASGAQIFRAAGTERMRLTSAGLLGLGTSSPSYLLHVNTAGASDIETAVQNSAGLSRYGTRASGNAFLGSFTAGKSVELWSAGSQIGVIDSTGRLGIGTTSPSSLLHLADAGNITVGTTTGTKIGTATTQKISLWNATPVVQPAAVANITTTATAGALPTPDGAVTIANTATPTVTELLEYCVELEAKLEDLLGKLRTVGIIAT
jgi:hypothetical protein